MKKRKLNKKEQARLDLYNRSQYEGIHHVYESYSHDKRRAEYFIRREMLEKKGYDYKIISFNSMVFTCGYRFKVNDKEYLRVHTKSTYYDIDMALAN